MTVQNILDYVNSLAPRHMKCDWDNVGLLCGRRDQEVKKLFDQYAEGDRLVTHVTTVCYVGQMIARE